MSWRAVLDKFPACRVLVVGDVMLDHFIWGNVSRISPEAPVPVVEVTRETEMPGGAGNVAKNLAALGAEVFLCGVVGRDSAGERLAALFHDPLIHTEGLVTAEDRPTIVKARVIAHHQQVVRVDREMRVGFSTVVQRQILQYLEKTIAGVSGVILSDYGKGAVSPEVIQATLRLARKQGVPVAVDPKVEYFQRYRHVSCLTPNLREAHEGMRRPAPKTEAEVEALGWAILKRLKSEAVLITRGEMGMTLFEATGRRGDPGSAVHIPARAKEVFDVTGAGDTVIAVLTLALASGAPYRLAAEVSNRAAGVVVGKLGTATCSLAELHRAYRNHA